MPNSAQPLNSPTPNHPTKTPYPYAARSVHAPPTSTRQQHSSTAAQIHRPTPSPTPSPTRATTTPPSLPPQGQPTNHPHPTCNSNSKITRNEGPKSKTAPPPSPPPPLTQNSIPQMIIGRRHPPQIPSHSIPNPTEPNPMQIPHHNQPAGSSHPPLPHLRPQPWTKSPRRRDMGSGANLGKPNCNTKRGHESLSCSAMCTSYLPKYVRNTPLHLGR